jgi:hypothetical protein
MKVLKTNASTIEEGINNNFEEKKEIHLTRFATIITNL